MPDIWLLEDDGITDELAPGIAAKGLRPVRLTRRERQIAALIIRRNYRQLCEDYGEEAEEGALADLTYEYLWMPSPGFPAELRPPRDVAVALVRSLDDDSNSRFTVRYYTDGQFRARRQQEDRQRRQAARLARAA